MRRILIVVDMQNDFIDGALGTSEAEAIVGAVGDKIAAFDGEVIFTRDTHGGDYLATQEGRNLPVEHCIRGSSGWAVREELAAICPNAEIIDKPTFGSFELAQRMRDENEKNKIASVTLIGLCTDICVISNAMLLKAALPETEIIVDASCCAGVTPERHRNALAAMKSCQIRIENGE